MTEAAQEDLTGMPTPKQDERTPGLEFEHLPGGYTLAEWQERARRDDCLERMVPSDLRQLLGIIERQRNAYGSTDALREALHAIEIQYPSDEKLEAILLDDDDDGPIAKHWARKILAARAALSGSPAPSIDWRSMDTARKNGRPVLGLFKQTFAPPCGDRAVERWGGTQIVMRHPGLADDGYDCGWNLINGGCGGFPDEWFEGWMPLPRAPDAARTALAGVTAPETRDASNGDNHA